MTMDLVRQMEGIKMKSDTTNSIEMSHSELNGQDMQLNCRTYDYDINYSQQEVG